MARFSFLLADIDEKRAFINKPGILASDVDALVTIDQIAVRQ